MLVINATTWLKYFVNANGIEHYSPWQLLKDSKVDFGKHCQIPIFLYIQAPHEAAVYNSQQPRTLDCLYMRPLYAMHGGHQLYHIPTGKLITRHGKLHVIPTPQHIIDKINAFGKKPNGSILKVESKDFPTWSAAVDDDATPNAMNKEQEDESQEQDIYDSEDADSDCDSDSDEEHDQDTVDTDESTHPEDLDVSEDEQEAHNLEEQDQSCMQEPKAQANAPNGDMELPDESVKVQDQVQDEAETQENIEQLVEDQEDTQGQPEGRIDEVDDRGRQVKRSARLKGQLFALVDVNHDKIIVFTRLMKHHNLLTSRQEQGSSSVGFNGFNKGCDKAVKAISFIETFSLKRGIAKFGESGREAAKAEIKQLHERMAFTPLHLEEMSAAEHCKTLESLIFLVQKRDGIIKARTCANGSVQRGWMSKEEAVSPTAAVELILLTAVIDAAKERCVATVDIQHAFIQTDLKDDKDEDRITMKMRGPIVDMLVELDCNLFHDKVVYEKKEKVLYVHVKKAIYGMIQSSLMFYKKLRADLESEGFKINPYDPCIANKMVNGKQMTIAWLVDDLKVSHKHEKAVNEFIAWLESKYGSKTGRVKAVKRNRHDYLGMILDFSKKGKVMVDMTGYVKKMLEEFPEILKDNVSTPACNKVFDIDKSPKLEAKRAELLHMFVAKALFIAKRGRPDIQVPVAFLCTRVQEPTE